MEQKDITLTIDGKMHKLVDGGVFCIKCSLYNFCNNNTDNISAVCPAIGLGGGHFVELKVEK